MRGFVDNRSLAERLSECRLFLCSMTDSSNLDSGLIEYAFFRLSIEAPIFPLAYKTMPKLLRAFVKSGLISIAFLKQTSASSSCLDPSRHFQDYCELEPNLNQ